MTKQQLEEAVRDLIKILLTEGKISPEKEKEKKKKKKLVTQIARGLKGEKKTTDYNGPSDEQQRPSDYDCHSPNAHGCHEP